MSLNEFSVQEIESLVDEKKRTLIYMYIGYAYKLKIGLSQNSILMLPRTIGTHSDISLTDPQTSIYCAEKGKKAAGGHEVCLRLKLSPSYYFEMYSESPQS